MAILLNIRLKNKSIINLFSFLLFYNGIYMNCDVENVEKYQQKTSVKMNFKTDIKIWLLQLEVNKILTCGCGITIINACIHNFWQEVRQSKKKIKYTFW